MIILFFLFEDRLRRPACVPKREAHDAVTGSCDALISVRGVFTSTRSIAVNTRPIRPCQHPKAKSQNLIHEIAQRPVLFASALLFAST